MGTMPSCDSRLPDTNDEYVLSSNDHVSTTHNQSLWAEVVMNGHWTYYEDLCFLCKAYPFCHTQAKLTISDKDPHPS